MFETCKYNLYGTSDRKDSSFKHQENTTVELMGARGHLILWSITQVRGLQLKLYYMLFYFYLILYLEK